MNYNIHQMNEKWIRAFMRLIQMLTVIIALVEFALYFPLDYLGITSGSMMSYLQVIVVTPLLANIGICIVTWHLLKKMKDRNAATYIPFFAVSAICFVVACVHNMFPEIMCIFILPILMSGIFGKKKLTNTITILNAALLCLSAALPIYDSSTWDSLHPIHTVIAYLLIFITYLMVGRLISYNRERIQMLRESARLSNELQNSLLIDKLTGLYNFTGYQQHMNDMFDQAFRGEPLTVAMIDLDNFKEINDRYGHENGNIVIRELAECLKKCVGEQGFACRYGGEEFVLLFHSIGLSDVKERIEDCRQDFLRCHYWFQPERSVSFSCGISVFREAINASAELIVEADQAMYQAKREGKNRICIFADAGNA